MKHRWSRVALPLAVVLVVAACGTDEPRLTGRDGDTGATQSLDGAWVLIAATVDGATLALDDQYRVTMTIEGSEISGRAACNSYGGAVSIDNGVFLVGDIVRTAMGCEPGVMEIESTFTQGLSNVTGATRSGDVAMLTGEGVELTFELVPPVPTADLIGSTWVLDTIIQGETASSTAPTADPATLLLDADGTFTGNTGCREISGQYVVAGDTVHFTSWSADGECPTDVEWQDGQVITVLEGGFTVAIDGDRLTLISPGGEGLSYTAEPSGDAAPATTIVAATPSTTTTVVIGESDFVVVPDESGGVPLDLEVGCPSGPTFPVSALSHVEPLVGSGRDDIEAAIAGFLGSAEGTLWPPADEWHVLYETDEEVVLVFVDPSRETIGFQTVMLVDGEWRWSGSQLGQGCPLEARLPEGLNRVNWRIDPAFGLDPADTTIRLLATERECASGQAMGDRLRSPHVVITDVEVRITLAADPPPGDTQTCPGNPEQSVAIELGMPLGDRAVVDGLVVLGDLADLIG